MKSPREDGLSSEDEFDNLIEHEKELDDFISQYPILSWELLLLKDVESFISMQIKIFNLKIKLKSL